MIGNKKTVKLKKAKKKVKWKIVAGKKNISIKKKGKLKNKLIVKGKKVGKAKIKAICGKKKYTLTTANDNEQYKGRNPKSWILYGSKDGNNWETIDVVNDSGMEDKNFKTYNYTVDKVGTYQYYKLDLQAIYGSGCQISEISMKGATVSPSKYDILFTGDCKDESRWGECIANLYFLGIT